jgi:hypothetical protein
VEAQHGALARGQGREGLGEGGLEVGPVALAQVLQLGVGATGERGIGEGLFLGAGLTLGGAAEAGARRSPR